MSRRDKARPALAGWAWSGALGMVRGAWVGDFGWVLLGRLGVAKYGLVGVTRLGTTRQDSARQARQVADGCDAALLVMSRSGGLGCGSARQAWRGGPERARPDLAERVRVGLDLAWRDAPG